MYYLLKRLVLRSAHPRAEPQKEVLFLTETVETIENISQNSNTLVQCLICAAWFAGFFIASRVFKHVVGPRLTRAAQKIERPYLSTLLQSFIRPCALFIALIGLYIGVRLLPFDFIHTDAWRTAQNHAVRIAFIVLLAWGLLGASKCVELALVGTRSRFDLGAGDTVIRFLERIYKAVILLFAGVLVVTEMGYNVNSLIAGLGLGGLTFALAAQDSASNFFGGLVIIFEKPFELGDWISTASLEGSVEDITFRSTKIRTLANALTVVPNSKLCGEPITNWTRMKMRLAQFTLGLTYGTPKRTVEAVTNRVRAMLENHPGVHSETVQVRLSEFADSSIDIAVQFYTKTTDIVEYRAVKEDVNLRIMDIMAGEGASFAFPSRSIYIENAPSLPDGKGAFAFCLTLAFFLAACGKAPVSSTGGASLPPASSGSAASSGALSTAGGASSAPASSSSSPSSESPSVDTSGWTRRFISLPVMHPDGGAGEKALVILSAPTDWEYDNYTTFTRDGIKVAEVLNLWPAASGASPFTDAMTEPYADNSFYPEGYGLLSTEDTELNGNALRILHMKTWPDDADKPWYPQYMF